MLSQGLFGGATNYEDQSIADINEDIISWLQYTEETKKHLEGGISALKIERYWSNIPFNFQAILQASIRCQNTNISDFNLILKAISKDRVSRREVELMYKIGKNATEYNVEFGQTFKEESDWKEYGNANFKLVEELYAEGRDYFVTLQDASNVSARLMDYINTVPPVVNQDITQTVNGDGNIIAGANNGSISKTENNSQEFLIDVDSLLSQLHELYDVDSGLKKFFEETLKESREAVRSGDLTAQTNTKTKMKSFLAGAGNNAFKLADLLGTYSSIASYFDF